jgi:hypothetical protein
MTELQILYRLGQAEIGEPREKWMNGVRGRMITQTKLQRQRIVAKKDICCIVERSTMCIIRNRIIQLRCHPLVVDKFSFLGMAPLGAASQIFKKYYICIIPTRQKIIAFLQLLWELQAKYLKKYYICIIPTRQ